MAPWAWLVAGCFLALAGCGAEDPEVAKREADERAVRAAIRESTTSDDPRVCTTVRTRAFVEQLEDRKGRAALRACRAALAGEAARAVDIHDVTVRGDRALTRFVPRGGTFDGQALTVKLLRGKRSWRLHELMDLELLDRPRFDRTLRRELAQPPDELSVREASCVVRKLRKVSDAKLERSIVTGTTRYLARPLVSCLIPAAFREAGFTVAQVDCALTLLSRRYSDAQLDELLNASSDASADRLGRLVSPCLT